MSGRANHLREQLQQAVEGNSFLGESSVNAKELTEIAAVLLEAKRREYDLFAVALLQDDGRYLLESRSDTARRGVVDSPSPNLAALRAAFQGKTVVRSEQSLSGEFLRSYLPLMRGPAQRSESAAGRSLFRYDRSLTPVAPNVVLLLTAWVKPEIGQKLARVISLDDEFNELRTYRRPLASSYLLTLAVVTLLVVFAAIWIGFYLARGISIPIGLLSKATEEVAGGNLNFVLPKVGDDELGVVVESFNKMTADLRETTGELEQRRRYMETVLSRVGVGVFSLDSQNCFVTCNSTAAQIAGLDPDQELKGNNIANVFPGELVEPLFQLLGQLSPEEEVISGQVSFSSELGSTHLQVTITKLLEESGVVILLDEITALVRAQRMAAWQEVAKRIAHEIKNPLTPIQLNAQRLKRRYGEKEETLLNMKLFKESDRALIENCSSSIIQQVETLRNLVDEFSQFARMPQVNLEKRRLEPLLESNLEFFRSAHPDIDFRLTLPEQTEAIFLDNDQFSQVLLNITDNSVASIEELPPESRNSERAFVEFVVRQDSSRGLLKLSIADNGIGISEEQLSQVLEPYFSTKAGGTGLGLAIVSRIIADHDGYLRVRKNPPRGACVEIELPIRESLNPQKESSVS